MYKNTETQSANTIPNKESFGTKLMRFCDKAIGYLPKAYQKAAAVETKAARYIKLSIRCINRTINNLINMIVKTAIVVIALIMACDFAKTNPELTNQIVSTATEYYNIVVEAIMNAYNTLFEYFNLFG